MQWLGRQQKCNSDIVSSVGIITQGVTNGFGQAKKRVSMEKNMLVKFVDSFVFHEETTL